MERPGLLEFAVYALVLAAFAGWVYALPPFTYLPARQDTAQIQPADAAATDTAGDDTATVIAASGEETAEADTPAVTPTAAPSQPGEEPATEAEPDLLVVTARSLNMRSEPNARSKLLGSYQRGSLVEKVETSGNWVRVRSGDETGWMYAGYLAAEN